jgi:hypothetical protein
MRIRTRVPVSFWLWIRDEKIRIRYKHPGLAALVLAKSANLNGTFSFRIFGMCAASPAAERDSTAGSGWCSTSAPTTDPNPSSVRSAPTTAPGGTILGQSELWDLKD